MSHKKKFNYSKHAVYSDIAPSQDQDLAIFVPRLEPPMNFNDFGGIIAKHFGSNNANLRFSSTSTVKLPNGVSVIVLLGNFIFIVLADQLNQFMRCRRSEQKR